MADRSTLTVLQRASGERLIIDCVLNEQTTFTSEVTDYPVESGGSISDNIRPLPITLNIEGIISTVPLHPVSVDRGNDAGVADLDAYIFLLDVRNKRETITVHTPRSNLLPNMVIEDFVIHGSAEWGTSLRFSLRLKQIETTKLQRVRVASRVGDKVKRGAQPLAFAEEKIVLWRKGLARIGGTFAGSRYEGGSPIIGETETVFWILPNGIAMEGHWYHTDRKTLLNAEELRRFKLDMARDKKLGLAHQPTAKHPKGIGPWNNNGPWSRGKNYDESPDKTKKPIDLNRTNKRIIDFPRRGRNAS